MKKQTSKSFLSFLISGVAVLSLMLGALPLTAMNVYAAPEVGTITLDGKAEDWAAVPSVNMPEQPNNGGAAIQSWRAARDAEGNVYLCLEGTANQWSLGNVQWLGLQITSSGGSVQSTNLYSLCQAGAEMVTGEAGASDGPVVVELCIPASYFADSNFTLSMGGSDLSSSELPVVTDNTQTGTDPEPTSEPAPTPEPTQEPVPDTKGKIIVDGYTEDWAGILAVATPEQPNNGGLVIQSWRSVRDTEGNVYLCLEGTANQWSIGNAQWLQLQVTDPNGSRSVNLSTLCQAGAQMATGGEFGISVGPAVVEMCIPAGYFTDDEFTLSLGGSDLLSSDLPIIDGTEDPEPDDPDPVYEGIVIDGKYADWKAVKKYPGNDPGNNLESMAMVFDGDQVYIYLKEAFSGSAAVVGNAQKGKYIISTDLGHELMLQVRGDGTVSGPAGVKAEHVGTQWEVAVPASALPTYLKTINFGIYSVEPVITEVPNLNGEESGGSFSGIVYDGLYGDWTYYPHTTLDTGGDGSTVTSALYADGNRLYGHADTNMPTHLNQKGGEMTSIAVKFNDSDQQSLGFRLVSVAPDGTIDYAPQTGDLEPGTYEFYIIDLGSGQDLKNINDEDPDSPFWLGKIMVTVSPNLDQCEFYLDLERVAKHFNCDPSDLKSASTKFFRELGEQWTIIAGTSSGPWLGVALCLAVTAAGALVARRRKHGSGAAAS